MSDATATTMPPHQAVSITPRNISFMETLPVAATWLNGDIVGTAVYNALSLTFPDGERMFMDAVRHYKHLLSGQLLQEANAFITQEAIHTREHVALNKMMDPAHYPLERIRAHIREQRLRCAFRVSSVSAPISRALVPPRTGRMMRRI